MKSFRLTPLNLVTAVFLFMALYTALYGAAFTGSEYQRWSGAIAGLFALFAIATFFLDMIFRNFIPETKRLWIVELSFVAFTTVLFLLLKS